MLGRFNCAPPSGDGEDFTLELKLQCHVQKREKFRIVCNHHDRWNSHLNRSYGHEFTLGHRSPPSIQNTLKTLSGTILKDSHGYWKCRISHCCLNLDIAALCIQLAFLVSECYSKIVVIYHTLPNPCSLMLSEHAYSSLSPNIFISIA
jgi:hypothetical protein